MSSNRTFLNSKNLIVLAFHKMQVQFSYGSNNFTPTQFENLLKYLSINKYTFISQNELADDIKEKSILITFDDGYSHLYKYLPQFIMKYNFKPLIFIPTKYIGKSNRWDYSHFFQNCPHMNTDMIKELSHNGVDFGAHSHSHTDLTSLTFNQLENELKRSKEILENCIGKKIISLCYPFGRYNENITKRASKLGYELGFTMKFPQSSDSSLSIGRYPIYGFDTMFSIKQKIEHGKLYNYERIKSFLISKLSGGTILLNKFKNRSGI